MNEASEGSNDSWESGSDSPAPAFAGVVAVLDACVLYPASLRDLFVTLAVEGLYLPRWTDAIHAEWIENLLEQDAAHNDPPRLQRHRLLRSRDLMERACPRSRVVVSRSTILIRPQG